MFGRYKHIHERALPYLQTRHNDVHVEICFNFALRLLEEETGDPEIVLPAVICHDLGWIMLPEDLQLKAFGPTFDPELRRIHEVEGVRLARQVLTEAGYAPDRLPEILDIINGHDSRLVAVSDNDRIVKDADKLFRYEPRGMSIDVGRFGLEPGVHASWLLERIGSWFFSASARRMAREELQKQRFHT